MEAYCPERRAHRIAVDASPVVVEIAPQVCSINPVFELVDAPKALVGVKLADRSLRSDEYAWDGHTLWIGAEIIEPAELHLEFEGRPSEKQRSPEK